MKDEQEQILPSFKKEQFIWFKARRELDLLRVDEDLMELPSLVQEAGECCAIANEFRDQAKEEFEVVKANLAQQLRDLPLNGGKVRSETMVESQLRLYEPYTAAQQKYQQARLDSALWATMIESMRIKSHSCRVVADLLNSGFLTVDYVRQRRRRDIRGVKANEE